MKIKSVYIEDYRSLKGVTVDFCTNGEVNPITVLAGINGSGKTSLLEFIQEVFKKHGLPHNNRDSILEMESENNENTGKYTYIINYGYFNHEYAFLQKNKSSSIYYIKANTPNPDAERLMVNYIDELIYEKDIKGSEAYQKLRETIDEILAGLDLQVKFSKLDKDKRVFFMNDVGEEFDIEALSTGEKEILTKVFPLFISGIRDSIILVDEPESSLHPNWQNEIMRLYRTVAEKFNNQFIIATHSPQIVSAVPNTCVKVLAKEDGKIVVVDVESKSFGRKVDEVLVEIFRVKGLRTPEVEQQLTELRSLLHGGQGETEAFTTLLARLEALIGYTDSDLALIRLEQHRRSKAHAVH